MVLFEIWSLGEKPFNDLTNPIVSVACIFYSRILNSATN